MGCITPDFDEAATLSTEQTRTARKPHKCNECRRQIEKGEKYEYQTTLFDGEWDHMHMCIDCVSVRDSLMSHGWTYGALWEDIAYYIEEEHGDLDWMAVEKCTPKAKAKIVEIFDSVET